MTPRRGVLTSAIALTSAVALLATSASAQRSLAARIDAVKTGRVRLAFAARDGVCGNGMSWFRLKGTSVSGTVINGNWSGSRDVEPSCEHGPVRVVVVRLDGETTEIRSYVGGTWRADTGYTDVGTVSAVEAGNWLLQVAEKGTTKAARQAVSAATLADSIEPAATLLRIAKDETRPSEVRSSVMNWLGEVVGDRVAGTLDSIAYDAGDREVRKQAIFAMSRRPADEAVPALLKMAESLPDRELRKTAVFWLAQSKDPRAVAWVERRLGNGK